MKKIVMGLAAVAMATSMFAADPAFAPSLAEYSGNQSVTWGINLDSNKTGFKNDGDAKLKFNLFTAGDKTTSGDSDIWAELKIKNDANDAAEATMSVPDAKVDEAKFHFGPVYVGIKAGDTLVGGCKPQTAIKSGNVGIEAVGPAKYDQGIVAGYSDDNFGLDIDFRSKMNGSNQYTNDYALAAEAAFKASNEFVTGLEVKAGMAYEFADDAKVAYAASAAYKVDLGDYYLKPTVGYTSANEMVGAVLFGWGDEADADAGVYYLKDLKKVTPGVSVLYKKDLDNDNDLGLYEIAFNLGSKVENLKAAALATMTMAKVPVVDETKTTLNIKAGCAYDIKADDITITTKAGCDWTKATKVMGTEVGAALKVSAGVDVAGVINNTTLSAEYVSGDLLADPDAEKGKVNFTAKIAL